MYSEFKVKLAVYTMVSERKQSRQNIFIFYLLHYSAYNCHIRTVLLYRGIRIKGLTETRIFFMSDIKVFHMLVLSHSQFQSIWIMSFHWVDVGQVGLFTSSEN